MFAISVTEKGGEQKRLEFDKPEVTIGRVQGNDIILPKGNVSKRHSRIVLKDGKFIIVDLKSTNGTYVNGRKITSPLVVKGTDKIYIGDFILVLEDGASAGASADAPPPPPAKKSLATTAPPPPPKRDEAEMTGEDHGRVEDESAGDEDDDDQRDARSDRGELDEGPPEPSATANDDDDYDEPEEVTPPPQEAPRATAPRITAQMAPTPAPSQSRATTAPREAVPAARPSAQMPAKVVTPAKVSQPPQAVATPAQAKKPSGPIAVARATAPQTFPAPKKAPSSAGATPTVDPDKRTLAGRLFEGLALGARSADAYGDAEVKAHAEALAKKLVADGVGGAQASRWIDEVVAEAVGVGPLEDLLGDDGVSEMVVAGFDRVFVSRGAGLEASANVFTSADALERAIVRLAKRAGVESMAAGGLISARLSDGVAMTAVLPPAATRGPAITLRRVRQVGTTMTDLVDDGIVSQQMADFLESAVRQRRNVLVCGAQTSGRSTIVGALAHATQEDERVALIEDAPEIEIGERPWISLRAGGAGARTAVVQARAMKATRLVVDGIRGAEALEIVAGLAAGSDGLIASVTAGSSREGLMRLEALARLAADAPSEEVVRAEIGRGVNVVVHVARAGDEVRVTEIADVSADDDGPRSRAVFQYKPDGKGGRFVATGFTPAWADGGGG